MSNSEFNRGLDIGFRNCLNHFADLIQKANSDLRCMVDIDEQRTVDQKLIGVCKDSFIYHPVREYFITIRVSNKFLPHNIKGSEE